MAYQQQGGLANGPGGSGEHHGPQGTEYTLQGEPYGEAHTRDGRLVQDARS
jgi:hypothetical protein